jgi:transposase-like protein/IS1 family transposase
MTCRKCNHSTVKKFGRHGRLRIQRYRCTSCSTTFSDTQTRPLGTMRIPEAEALQALRCLLEGCSIRSTERLTGLHRDTIMSLLVLVGERCAKVMDSKMRGLTCKYVQCDEIWTFCGKKQKQLRNGDPAEFGDAWVYAAIDAESKLVPCYAVGKRTRGTTDILMHDLSQRLANKVQITTDALVYYVKSIARELPNADYARLVKLYGQYGQHDTAARYSPSPIVEVISKVVQGDPDNDHISTSFIERQNLTMRMSMRRFTRLTNAFSKKLDNLKAACALHFAFYNFCRVHQTLRATPAMKAGITNHAWSLEELLRAA